MKTFLSKTPPGTCWSITRYIIQCCFRYYKLDYHYYIFFCIYIFENLTQIFPWQIYYLRIDCLLQLAIYIVLFLNSPTNHVNIIVFSKSKFRLFFLLCFRTHDSNCLIILCDLMEISASFPANNIALVCLWIYRM